MMYLADATLRHLEAVATWPEFPDGRYEIAEELGRGGMGTVYAARDTALERDVAIKIGNALPSTDLQARLTREARVLARLEHPGIVPVHDWGLLADGRPFYVMKRVAGRTLRAFIDEHPPLAERLRVFERVCEAVAFAHAGGVIHRDLTPANVMVGGFGEVMVMDWGLAAIGEGWREPSGPAIAEGVVMGTRGFMAPEQSAGGAIDARADVYALGALLAAMLEGSRATVERRRGPSGPATKALHAIAARAMAERPADRYPGVDALAADIAAFRNGGAVSAHRESVVERALRFARVYRTPILLVLAYIVMRASIALFGR
jgi:serine/threonine protein kinase